LSAEEGKDGDDENHDPAAVHLSLRGAQGNILPADDVAFGPEGEGRTGKTAWVNDDREPEEIRPNRARGDVVRAEEGRRLRVSLLPTEARPTFVSNIRTSPCDKQSEAAIDRGRVKRSSEGRAIGKASPNQPRKQEKVFMPIF
jgi:hypothetical protein